MYRIAKVNGLVTNTSESKRDSVIMKLLNFERYLIVKKNFMEKTRLVDFGSSVGDLVSFINKKKKYLAFGIEPETKSRNIAIKNGWPVP